MYYYYKNNGVVIETKEKPHNKKYIQLERALPVPQKNGYLPKLNMNDSKVWYDLCETEKHKEKEEIEILKKKLSNTDYKAIKYAEGQLTEEEYGPIKQERQSWRNRINELELEQIQETEV